MADKLVIRNIGLMLSGALEKPILDADTLVAEDGRITAFGKEKDIDIAGADTTIGRKKQARNVSLTCFHPKDDQRSFASGINNTRSCLIKVLSNSQIPHSV